MADAVQLAISLGAKPDYLHACCLVAGHGVHLCSGELDVNGPVQNFRRECRDECMRPDVSLAAKPAAEKVTDDVDLLLWNTENHGNQLPGSKDVLRSFIQRQRPISAPHSSRCVRLHLIVMTIRSSVRLFELDWAGGNRL